MHSGVRGNAIDEITNLVYDILIRRRSSLVVVCTRFFVARPSLQYQNSSLVAERIEWSDFKGCGVTQG